MKKLILISFPLLFISAGDCMSAVTADSIQTVQDTPLFSSDAPIELTLMIDMKIMMDDDSEDPEYTEGQLRLHHQDGTEQEFFIKVRPRGYSRRFFDFCSFPPLKLNFKKKQVKGSVFEGQDKLKLVTFCKDVNLNQYYVLKEYLVYKMYNRLTPNSFRVRLARITYCDINNKGKNVTRYGYFIEDEDMMAARIGGQVTEALVSTHDKCNHHSVDIFTMFQYMIGNTDWWIARPKQHNVKLVVLDSGGMIPVPYDFDYCGVVNANYAAPPEKLPIGSVTERYFRGYCRPPGTYESVVEHFNTRRADINTTVTELDLLTERQQKSIINYLDQFYDIVNNPKQLRRNVYNRCELKHEHVHVAKKNK